ncbi:hypothetical protein [Cryptosporangium sp. NPDC051539]|uniref:hypothetical protein n=1 Tax=Cryptosporangium sp. NPDC051539 TaxID=3363962 RepID=UPI0037983EC8
MPPAPSAPEAAEATESAEAAVLAQYRAFWTDVLPVAAAAPAEQRKRLLGPVTTEPELSHLLRNWTTLDAAGQRNYGRDEPRESSVRVQGGLALVEGCLDSHASGVADAATGAPVTRGEARNPVRATLVLGADGVWRLSAITYSGIAPC